MERVIVSKALARLKALAQPHEDTERLIRKECNCTCATCVASASANEDKKCHCEGCRRQDALQHAQ